MLKWFSVAKTVKSNLVPEVAVFLQNEGLDIQR